MRRPDLQTLGQTQKEVPFPSRFAVEVCADCNLRCSMCHHEQMVRPKGRMPFPLWTKCADEVAARSPRTQCWFSFCGEPLLEAELLLRMLDYGATVGLKSLNINTNGMLLNEELSWSLVRSPAERIVIGIDGLSSEVYARMRCGGDRDHVYEAVEGLLAARGRLDRGPEITVQFIETEENTHEKQAFCDYWLARGAVVKVRHQLSWGGRFETALQFSDDERIPCPWAMTMMHVFWDGRVPRCPGDTEGETCAGNAWDSSLADLWLELGRYRALHLARQFGALPERCQQCRDWMVGVADRLRPSRSNRLPVVAS